MTNARMALIPLAGLACLTVVGCPNLPGTSTRTMDDGPVATGISGKLGDPMPGATAEQLATFERGKAVALRHFNLSDGLGPRST